MTYKVAVSVALLFFFAGFFLFFIRAQNELDIDRNVEIVELNYSSAANTEEHSYSCVAKTEEKIVRGNSLSGLIENGDTIKLLFDYYMCNEVKRGDVVAYEYAGNDNLIIKVVKGLPNDRFRMEKSESDCGWNILINDEAVRNSEEISYVLGEQGYRMLSLYERNYEGIIPENTYIILGNLVHGSMDSTRFGLVDKGDIVGKVVVVS
ncbi:MAG: signal peptidase I [Candidatus Nanohalarchaeota archaeon]|nr:MAG: signal peptidase I [Candidatus Nanohaloarchaeota archaeon]